MGLSSAHRAGSCALQCAAGTGGATEARLGLMHLVYPIPPACVQTAAP